MYSKEEIERKRQEALDRQQKKRLSVTSPLNNGSSYISNQTNQVKTPNNSNSSPYGILNQNNKSITKTKQLNVSTRYNPIKSNSFYDKFKKEITINCSMISSTRFVAELKPFDAQVIDMMKTIPTKSYDPKTKYWNFHVSDYLTLHKKVMNLSSDIKIIGLPSFVKRVFINLINNPNSQTVDIDFSHIDQDLMSSLYQFQKEGVRFGIMKNGKVLIADDMGLGKTRQALAIADYYKHEWPLLIITPSSLRCQWCYSISEHLKWVPMTQVQEITTAKSEINGESKVIIMSYDLAAKRTEELGNRKFSVVIVDESHYLKNGRTGRFRCLDAIANYAKRLILLTGTPALSKPIELYTQIRLLEKNFMNYHEFGMRYCNGKKTRFGHDYNGSSNLKELELLLKAVCMIRRLKSDVMSQLPSKIRQKIILDPSLIEASSKEMQKSYKEMQKHFVSETAKHSALLQYYQETSIAKEKAVCNYITDLLEKEQKFLIFAHHQRMMDAISEHLQKKKITFMRIDGRTSPDQRKFFVDSFQSNSNMLVAVLSITAANAGITLTAARLVVFAELSWNPGILCQAEDRVHRIGQTSNVVIQYLLAKNTADDYMWPKIQKKIEVLNGVGLEQNFDLEKANVQMQAPERQETLNAYFDTEFESSFTSSINNNENVNVQNNVKSLLDEDDDGFNDIDLDNFA